MWKSLNHVQLSVTPWSIQSMEFSRPEYWSGKPFPSPGDLPNPGIEPSSPALQAEALPAEPQGKPKNTGVSSLSLLQQIFPTKELNWGLQHCRQIFYHLSHQGSPPEPELSPKSLFKITDQENKTNQPAWACEMKFVCLPHIWDFPGTLNSCGVRKPWASLVAQLVKPLPTMQETWVQSLGWEGPLEKGHATHFSILAWRILWTV